MSTGRLSAQIVLPVHPAAVHAARDAIAETALRTPVISSAVLGEQCGAAIDLKLENLQVTGSFKVRGAANKLHSLTDEERQRGVVTCSSGNHGRAVAYVAEALGVTATICVPEWVDHVKLAAIEQHGAEAVTEGATYDEAEARSITIAKERGLTYVSPFDDPFVIAGQGTIGLELLEQVPGIDTAMVPLSGGGLISGIALALKSSNPNIRVVGVSATNARVMFESLKAGQPTSYPEEETIANALSGGIGDNHYTFQMVRALVDSHVLVSEEEIRTAMRFAAREHKLVVEGGGAVALAAMLANKVESLGKQNAVILSGGNVGTDTLARVLSDECRGPNG